MSRVKRLKGIGFVGKGKKKRNYTIVINSELYLYNKNVISFSFFFKKK
jgi:hypothetical protein